MRAQTRDNLNAVISTLNIPVGSKQKIVNLVEDLEAEIESKNHEIHHLSKDLDMHEWEDKLDHVGLEEA